MTTKPDKTAKPDATVIHAVFAFEKETPNSLRFKEIDDDGNDAGAWSKVGTLYVKKTSFPKGQVPKKLMATISIME